MSFILALDQGTTSSRALVFDHDGTIRGLWSGYRRGDERYLREAIESALRGEALPTAAKK